MFLTYKAQAFQAACGNGFDCHVGVVGKLLLQIFYGLAVVVDYQCLHVRSWFFLHFIGHSPGMRMPSGMSSVETHPAMVPSGAAMFLMAKRILRLPYSFMTATVCVMMPSPGTVVFNAYRRSVAVTLHADVQPLVAGATLQSVYDGVFDQDL